MTMYGWLKEKYGGNDAGASKAELKLYECRRYKDFSEKWLGALLIMARNEDKATELFKSYERTEEPPEEIVELDISSVGVIYNDESRL